MQVERQLSIQAAKKGCEAAAPLLQERGSAVDAQDSDGRTALMRVAEAGD
jgi:ankyrin repeat protein